VTEHHYQWSLDGKPPNIHQHSIAKHDVLRAYLTAYFQTLISSPFQDRFILTLVDGFAGGGIYRHAITKAEVLGSPFVMLESAKEAEFLINHERRKKVRFDLAYFFIEADKTATQVLRQELTNRDYGSLFDQSIFVKSGRFQDHVTDIIGYAKKRSKRAARAIFLLDQYGYSKVPTHLIRTILTSLPGAEIILTFAVDSFLNFASDFPSTQKTLGKVGIPNALRGRSIDEIKRSDPDWRLYIQSCLYKELIDKCGASYYTPFFIRSTNGHGDYWLIHLSQHPRARDVMTRVHWGKNNHFIHYGDAGLDMFNMLGYVPSYDSNYTGQSEIDFKFDDFAHKKSIDTLQQQIPHLVYDHRDGMSFGELFSHTCNDSPASSQIYREAIGALVLEKDIQVVSPEGVVRRSYSQINDKDQIMQPRQRKLFSFHEANLG
jgi:three-Cys-motif partner protein